ncbi:MAG TPA: hypothetical protein VGU25_11290 [Acidobacteriaceae bacterium]|nr:hypothetical protein [Acidobacteriaceae bacterium]
MASSLLWHRVRGDHAFAICLALGAAQLTSVLVERAALALLAIGFLLSMVVDLHSANLLHVPVPSFRLVFLTLNNLVALLLAIRFVQVLREPPLRGILSRTPTPKH